MTDRRTLLLEAAVSVVAADGVRGLTHRAVDAAAQLPAGSTSNAFRSRAALLEGVLQHILATERAQLAQLPELPDVPAVVAAAVDMARFLLGPGRSFTLARHALFLDAARRTHTREAVGRASSEVFRLVADRLAQAGVAESPIRARLLLTALDGVLLDHLVRPDTAPPLEVALPALLGPLLTQEGVSP
jgi:DNA-binding transcriptional regulator YbjK